MSNLTAPVVVEKSELSTTLNSTILFSLLIGIYTPLYFGTLYSYVIKKSSQRRIVIGTITMLYILSIIQLGLVWYMTVWQFVDGGDTRDTIFFASFFTPPGSYMASCAIPSCIFLLSDGLLIWRCFHVWGRSSRVLVLPVILFIGETAIDVAVLVLRGLSLTGSLTDKQAKLTNGLVSASYFLSLGTTIIATLLIGYRIYSVSKEGGNSMRRFKNILDIIVQSSALYSLVSLVAAVAAVLPETFNAFDYKIAALNAYSDIILFAISAIVPTIMVARVSFLGENIEHTNVSTTPKLSGLRFGHRSARNDDSSESGVGGHHTILDFPINGQKTQ